MMIFNSYMFRRRNAFLRECTKTKKYKSKTHELYSMILILLCVTEYIVGWHTEY